MLRNTCVVVQSLQHAHFPAVYVEGSRRDRLALMAGGPRELLSFLQLFQAITFHSFEVISLTSPAFTDLDPQQRRKVGEPI